MVPFLQNLSKTCYTYRTKQLPLQWNITLTQLDSTRLYDAPY